MGILAQRALRRVHTGVSQRNFQLLIGGEPFTEQVRSLAGTFDPRAGGSAVQISVRDTLEGLEDAIVELSLGYGGTLQNYFRGVLAEPGDLSNGKGTAYGPFKAMTDQQLGEDVTYQGVPLAFVFKDLEDRAGLTSGYIDIVQGTDTVETSFFTEQTNLSEVANSLADKSGYVFYDRPGGRRLMPLPKTTVGGTPKALYSPHNYSDFSVSETRTSHYSQVIVGRKEGAGDAGVRAVAPVMSRSKFDPPANRIHYILDFPGTADAAQQHAYDVAARLSYGEYSFSLGGMWINPELECWDTILVEAVERKSRVASPTGVAGKFLVTYRCLISRDFSFQIDANTHHMDVGGEAVRIGAIRLPDPIKINAFKVSPGTIPPNDIPGLKPNSGLKPNVGLKPRRTLFNFEATGQLRVIGEGGLKPNIGLKPNVGLKPKRSRLTFTET